MEPNQLFLTWCVWSWLIWVLVKMLITWSWFLQNSSARSYFKRSLIPPLWSYIMLQTLKNQRTKCSWIQFHVFTCNQNGFRLLKWLKETRFYKRKKKIIIETWTLYSMQEVGRKKKLARCFKKWESYISVLKKEKKNSSKKNRIFSLAWNIVY